MLSRFFTRSIRFGTSQRFEYQFSHLEITPTKYVLRRAFSMASNGHPNRAVGKKLVIACDGTWENSDSGKESNPTNVTRIVRALNHYDENNIPQIAYYQRGLGTDGDLEDKILGGMTGNDISEHIREAYAFIANNYEPFTHEEVVAGLKDASRPMDEIVLLGFSRGAYTARAISSIITDMGLLTRFGMESFWGIFSDWQNQDVEGKESAWFIATYPKIAKDFEAAHKKPIAFTDIEYKNKLIKDGLTRWGMPIRAVGVWDTVGSLGIPKPMSRKNVKPYSFVNTKVAQHIQYAFHAMAIDERRHFFTPTIWEKPDDIAPGQPAMLKKLKQCWFPGSHSNIGGSYDDAEISNISLAWMISQLEDNGKILSFNQDYLNFVQDLSNKWYVDNKEAIRPWGFGTLYDSSLQTNPESFIEGIDPITRTPGRYDEVDIDTGKSNGIPLKDTNEYIHSCVRIRIDGGGKGIQAWTTSSTVDRLLQAGKQALGLHSNAIAESDSYKPKALSNYTLKEGAGGVVWQALDGGKSLYEDELGSTERRLLERSTKFVGLTKL